jgi:hypothetical protein
MDNDVAGIKDDPVRRLEPLFKTQAHTELFELVIDMVGDRAHLPDRISGANDEIIAKIHQFTHVQDNNVQCFYIGGKLCD